MRIRIPFFTDWGSFKNISDDIDDNDNIEDEVNIEVIPPIKLKTPLAGIKNLTKEPEVKKPIGSAINEPQAQESKSNNKMIWVIFIIISCSRWECSILCLVQALHERQERNSDVLLC